MTTCSHCNGPLEDTPCGDYCETCRWYFAGDTGDADPGPALPMWIDVLTDGNAIRTPYGMCSSGFDSHNPPWQGGKANY